MFEFGCTLFSPPQELDIIRRVSDPPEDNAGQVGPFLPKSFSFPAHKSTLSAVARQGTS